MVGTYNGEKYIREQLDSILSQKDVDVFIKVTDDCSTDSTQEILREYKNKYQNFDFFVNEVNKNFTYNFLDLFFSIKNDDYDYYAFSDQDDVWLPEKLSKAISAIENKLTDNPNGILYCSNLFVVNENLEYIRMQEDESIEKCNKNNFMFENIATGCTVVFDRAFKRHAQKYYPNDIKLHDYWLFLIAAYTANYIYDKNAYILYRQHGTNQIGSNKKKWTLANIRKFFGYKGVQSKLVEQLIEGYADEIDRDYYQDLIYLRDYKKKFGYKKKLCFGKKHKKRNHNFILKLKILFNKL